MSTRPPHSSLPLDVLIPIQNATFLYTYKAIPMVKNPFDLALYSMLLWNLKPRSIIEIGSHCGGSALWLADQLRCFNVDGHVWSYDICPVLHVSDPNVTFAVGDAMDIGKFVTADNLAQLARPLLVIEDGNHQRSACLAILEYFDQYMYNGEYIVIEDGIVNDVGIADQFDGGPSAAIETFLERRGIEWEINSGYCDFFGNNVTWNVNGFLRKKALALL